MKIEAGKEVEFAGHRLKTIVFFAERTRPVDGDWEGYAKTCLRLIAKEAREAQTALAVAVQ